MSITREELVDRLRAAVESRLEAREAAKQRSSEAKARRGFAMVKEALSEKPQAKPTLEQLAQEIASLMGLPPEPAGDRWAVACEVNALEDGGVPPHRVAHALIEVGFCKGPPSPIKVSHCEAKVRQERHRYRLWEPIQ